MKDLKKLVKNGIAYAVIGILVYGCGKSILDQGEWERARREAAWSVDADANRVITESEWGNVYQTLGLNNTKKEGVDLTTEQYQDYFAKIRR